MWSDRPDETECSGRSLPRTELSTIGTLKWEFKSIDLPDDLPLQMRLQGAAINVFNPRDP
jgi:hypothetical protein